MKHLLPFLHWPRPDAALLRSEALGGLTVGLMVLPQGVAYAALAGMPLEYRHYASSMLPALIAVLFSASTRLVGGANGAELPADQRLAQRPGGAGRGGMGEPGGVAGAAQRPAANGAGAAALWLAVQPGQCPGADGVYPGGGGVDRGLATARAAGAVGRTARVEDGWPDVYRLLRTAYLQRPPAPDRAVSPEAGLGQEDQGKAVGNALLELCRQRKVVQADQQREANQHEVVRRANDVSQNIGPTACGCVAPNALACGSEAPL